MTTEKILHEIIYPAVDELGEDLPKREDTVLFGDGATLDSIGLVSFIVIVERLIDEKYGQRVTLANEKAFSRSQSPFRTVASLVEYIKELCDK